MLSSRCELDAGADRWFSACIQSFRAAGKTATKTHRQWQKNIEPRPLKMAGISMRSVRKLQALKAACPEVTVSSHSCE